MTVCTGKRLRWRASGVAQVHWYGNCRKDDASQKSCCSNAAPLESGFDWGKFSTGTLNLPILSSHFPRLLRVVTDSVHSLMLSCWVVPTYSTLSAQSPRACASATDAAGTATRTARSRRCRATGCRRACRSGRGRRAGVCRTTRRASRWA
eukprot:2897523-Rhodomonas_salina.2